MVVSKSISNSFSIPLFKPNFSHSSPKTCSNSLSNWMTKPSGWPKPPYTSQIWTTRNHWPTVGPTQIPPPSPLSPSARMAHAAKTSTQASCTAASTGFHASPASPGWCGGAPWPRALGRGRPARKRLWWGSWGAELDAAQKCGPAAESTMARVLNPRRSATIVIEVASRCRRRLHRRHPLSSSLRLPLSSSGSGSVRPPLPPSPPDSGGAALILAASAVSAYASLGCGCRLAVVVAFADATIAIHCGCRRHFHSPPLRKRRGEKIQERNPPVAAVTTRSMCIESPARYRGNLANSEPLQKNLETWTRRTPRHAHSLGPARRACV